MDPSRPAEAPCPSPDALEFVRFCYRRRRVGWPELYDEMCAVAGRGLYRGWRFAELEERGIGFSLQQTLELARIASQVLAEEGDRRSRSGTRGVEAAVADAVVAGSASAVEMGPGAQPSSTLAPVRQDERSFEVRIAVPTSLPEPAKGGSLGPGPTLVPILVGSAVAG